MYVPKFHDKESKPSTGSSEIFFKRKYNIINTLIKSTKNHHFLTLTDIRNLSTLRVLIPMWNRLWKTALKPLFSFICHCFDLWLYQAVFNRIVECIKLSRQRNPQKTWTQDLFKHLAAQNGKLWLSASSVGNAVLQTKLL